jgi:hypothetical protein
MMKYVRRWHVLATALTVAVFVSAGCSGKGDGDKKDPDKKGGDGGDNGVGDTKPAFSLTVNQFVEERKKAGNEIAALRALSKKYEGKVLEMSGFLHEIDRNGNLELASELNPKDLGRLIICDMVDKQSWLKATPGQKVKLLGKSIGGLRLEKCVITEASGSPSPTLTAVEFEKEFDGKPETWKKKYKSKCLFLTGEIAAITSDPLVNAPRVELKTAGKTNVSCDFLHDDADKIKALKPGQKVKILGRFQSVGFSAAGPLLGGCILIEDGK